VPPCMLLIATPRGFPCQLDRVTVSSSRFMLRMIATFVPAPANWGRRRNGPVPFRLRLVQIKVQKIVEEEKLPNSSKRATPRRPRLAFLMPTRLASRIPQAFMTDYRFTTLSRTLAASHR
jgi:hypothetical protein